MASTSRALRLIGHVEETIAALLLIGIAAVVLLQVAGRYLFVIPFIWPEELTRLMLVWLTFIASAAVTRRGAHIAVDMAIRRLPAVAALIVCLLVELAIAGTFLWIALLAARLAGRVATLPLAATQWPMAVMVWPAAVGCGLIALHATIRAVEQAIALARRDAAAQRAAIEREIIRS